MPHPGVLQIAQGEARRVPRAGSVEQPVPDLRGTAPGGGGRREEQDRAAEADGRGSVRSRARRAEAREEHAGLAERIPGGARGGPRIPAPGGGVHRGRDRHVARLQAREGSGSGRAAAASLRILLVLRRLTGGLRGWWRMVEVGGGWPLTSTILH